MFGSDKIKGYIKGALGTQRSHLKRTGLFEISDTDWGFYGGGSAGLNYFINEMFFLNAEYELAWLVEFILQGWFDQFRHAGDRD